MGGKLSLVDECSSGESQRVKDCCHLEGETPVEIRIAYQHPRPAAQPASASTNSHNNMAGAWDRAQAADGFYNPKQAAWPHGSMDAEKPPMPRGAERLRLPPPAGSARAQPRTPHSAASVGGGSGSDFDADTFAAPPDSERSDVAATPGRMQQPVALQVLQLPDDDYFPEIVRVGRQEASTFREASATYRGAHHGDAAAAAAAPALATPQGRGSGGGAAGAVVPGLDGEDGLGEASLVAAAIGAEEEAVREAVMAPICHAALPPGAAPPLSQPPAPAGGDEDRLL